MLWLNLTGSSVTISSKLTSRHIRFRQIISQFDCGICIKLIIVLLPTVLDPRISYLCPIHTYRSQPEQLAEVKARKLELERHYEQHYAPNPMSTNVDAAAPIGGTSGSPMQLDFTSRYTDMDFGDRNELTEYFQLVPEHWGKCEPVSW